jgi:hypothetical protein
MSITTFAADKPAIFWGEMAPCEHVAQIYSDEGLFLDALEGFITAGLQAGESAIVVATDGHLAGLGHRIRAANADIDLAQREDRYLAVPAEEMLSRFMNGCFPDESRFLAAVGDLIDRAGKGGRKVRVFGEMVAVLWTQGNLVATIQLELMWNRVCQHQKFPLFCAYPKLGFVNADAAVSIRDICAAHSRVFYT